MGLIFTIKGANYSIPEPTDVVDNFKARFEAAGGTLTTVQYNALTKLIDDLGFSASSFEVLYPFLGTTSATQAVGLFSSTNMTFMGTGTHTSAGYGNSSTAYAKPHAKSNTASWTFGCFMKETSNSPTTASACFGQMSEKGRMVASGTGTSQVNYGAAYRNTTNNIDATIRGTRYSTTPKYMITGDDNTQLYLLSSHDSQGLTLAHGAVNYSDMIQEIFIGGVNNQGSYVEPMIATYYLFFKASYLSLSEAKTVAAAINTFLSTIGRG